MAKIVLIHGYGAGAVCPSLKITRRLTPYNGFTAFKELVETNQAVMFNWYTEQDFTLFEYINLKRQYTIYRSEQRIAQSPQTLHNLHTFLTHHQPELILAFSLGTKLLFNYFEAYNIPDELKTIVTAQGDVPRNFRFTNKKAEQKLQNNSTKWVNFYCPWDPLLPISILLNKTIPSGLWGSANKYARNKLYPLHSGVALHASILHDSLFRDKILQLIK
jgi:hypothetical protein